MNSHMSLRSENGYLTTSLLIVSQLRLTVILKAYFNGLTLWKPIHQYPHVSIPPHTHTNTHTHTHTHTHTCSQRTVITVIDLLAAVCLVKGGHSKIMEAVDNFKRENGEQLRFEKLVTAFMDHSSTSDFQVGLHCWLDPEST